MVAILEQAKRLPPPRAAAGYEQAGLRLLATVCRELRDRSVGQEPFYLACRTAGRMLDVDHSTASRWLWLLAHDGIVEEVEKGDRSRRRASRYRYLATD